MKAQVRPNVTTRYLDDVGKEVMDKNGARSAPSMVYHFPGANCISLNDEAVHGDAGGARRFSGIRDWQSGRTRGAQIGLRGDPRTRRARNRADDPRVAACSKLSRSGSAPDSE